MRRWFLVSGVLISVPLICIFSYIALSVCLVWLTIPQLPSWAQKPALDWVIDKPQETYGQPFYTPYAYGDFPLDGYSGPESFICLLPPVRGYLTDRYGTQRPGNWMHRGVDYGTYFESVDVRTPFGGKVVFAGWKGPYGQLVVIENGGFQFLLAHHREIDVVEGQVVTASDIVGRSGSTGNSTGIHVHIEVRRWDGVNWMAENPEETLLPGQKTKCDWETLAAP